MSDARRLIEVAFPLRRVSLDAVHEKNVRHGHISTLHIWPARRPLAACRAALVASLLPDPGSESERRRLLRRLAGELTKGTVTKRLPGGRVEHVEVTRTEGGILHWGRETSPELDWFRERIREAHGGRAPRVLDPFAGGGAIPLEAMRLGCEVTAADINPVAWFLLRCTLEYPHRLAGERRPLPDFALASPAFMEQFLKSGGVTSRKRLRERLEAVQQRLFPVEDADLAWHVRAWGRWVLEEARRRLARFYPTYAELEALAPREGKSDRALELRPVPLDSHGRPDIEALNREFDAGYLAVPSNPRWVPKPTVAYLWARTVRCKACRAEIPLLKTRWLCKRRDRRVLLTLEPNPDRTGVVFGIQHDVPVEGRNPAERREHDRRIGQGTVSRSGAWCPCCGRPGTVAMTMEDIRQEGRAGRLGAVMTAVVVAGQRGKEYRLPTELEIRRTREAAAALEQVFREVPFGVPDEPLPGKEALGIRVPLYGLDRWSKLFTPRQLLALGTFVAVTREARAEMERQGYPDGWIEALIAYLACAVDRLADFSSSLVTWANDGEFLGHTFVRYALPMVWDFAEGVPLSYATGGFLGGIEWVAKILEHLRSAACGGAIAVYRQSARSALPEGYYDLILTDPPYYDAIPYSDLMDFFHVWLRRTLHGLSPELDAAFAAPLGPKWDPEAGDGELIDDASRFGGDRSRSRAAYEKGMLRAFRACHEALKPDGRMVVVFASKSPEAWESLVGAMIRAGFVVTASWPIETERRTRTRSLGSAALASSIWLVCRKRPPGVRAGWDARVLAEMRERIRERLAEFWDAGIRGPDFVWAATGPALEAYSRYPAVKKANAPDGRLEVAEFLRAVRRMVVEYVVGRVLAHNGAGAESAAQLDDVTTYYLLHRHDFGMGEAPAGACILYALSCGLSDRELEGPLDLIARGRSRRGDEETDGEGASGGGSTYRLKAWNRRSRRGLGLDAPGGRPVPLIDRVHRLMRLWRAGDREEVDAYLKAHGLPTNPVFPKLLQALVELADPGSEERSMLESIANHVKTRGSMYDDGQPRLEGM